MSDLRMGYCCIADIMHGAACATYQYCLLNGPYLAERPPTRAPSAQQCGTQRCGELAAVLMYPRLYAFLHVAWCAATGDIVGDAAPSSAAIHCCNTVLAMPVHELSTKLAMTQDDMSNVLLFMPMYLQLYVVGSPDYPGSVRLSGCQQAVHNPTSRQNNSSA
jgi:hypothetical protein